MLLVRPAALSDIDDLVFLAKQAGPGFTSLSMGREALEAKLARSENSFSAKTSKPGDQSYLLMLENSETGKIVGVSAVKAKVGHSAPYFNYKLLRQTQSSKVVDLQFDMDMMVLVNEYSGATEVGTLFVEESVRGPNGIRGAGRLISQSRYMLMACAPERFGDIVISELRGLVSDEGKSVVWDAVGKKFFKMEFGEADRISAETDNEFIVDLMPKYPIYLDLLPKVAREAIGVTHPAGAGAKRFLEAEGFRYDRMVDIFDGGPTMRGYRDQLRTVRDSRILPARAEADQDLSHMALISNNKINGFRCILASIGFHGDQVCVSPDTLDALQLSSGDDVRFWIKS